MSEVLAHAGGWDEALLFVVPAVVALLLVRWAERRSRKQRPAETEHEDAETSE